MKLVHKPNVAIISVFFCLATFLYISSKMILLGSFAKIEEKYTIENVQRALSAINDDLAQLNTVAGDNAGWDEAYQFVQDGNAEFIKANCDDTIFPKLRLNVYAYAKDSGDILYSKAFDLKAGKAMPFPVSLLSHITPKSRFMHHRSIESVLSGILLLPEGPLLIVSRPVLRGNFNGPIRGTIIMGRFLDAAELKRLTEITHLSITLFRVDDPQLPRNIVAIRDSLSNTNAVQIEELSRYTISGYGLINDIFGKPALIVRIDMPRMIYNQGVQTVSYFIAWFLAICLIFSLIGRLLYAKVVHFKKESKDTEARYHSVISQVSDSILLLDIESLNILESNAAFRQLLGYSPDEILTLCLCDILAEDQTGLDCHFRRLNDEKHSFQEESALRCKNGTFVPVELSVNLISIGDQRVICMVVRDITERKAAEEIQQTLEKRYHGLFDNAPISLWEEDYSGVKMFIEEQRSSGVTDIEGYFLEHPEQFSRCAALVKVVDINQATLDLYRASNKNHFSSRLPQIFTDDSKKLFRRILFHMANGGTFLSSEDENHNLRGEKISTIVTWAVAPGYEESYEKVYVSVVDMTERKTLESQLYQAQKMEEIGQLAGGVAHDFNNILTAILGYTYLILLKAADDDPMRGYVNQIHKSAERAAALTHGLLSYSRKQVMVMRPTDLNSIVTELEPMLRRLIREDIELSLEITSGEVSLMADLGKIEQVLMNLVTNAKDAMKRGGKIIVSTARITMNSDFLALHGYGTAGEYSCVTVTDTGCGMTEETKKKIFEPFFTTKEPGEGTGLGLAIIYGIIKQHHGYITIDSEPGHGATFRVYFPAVDVKPEKRQSFVQVEPPGGKETILLAEDDPAVSFFHQTLLEGAGYTVFTADDGEKALDCFRKNADSIDLMLLDVVMPKKAGNEVLQTVRAMKPSVKAIFLSGYAPDTLNDDESILQSAGFLSKPVDPLQLLMTIRKTLGE